MDPYGVVVVMPINEVPIGCSSLVLVELDPFTWMVLQLVTSPCSCNPFYHTLEA